MLIYDAHCHLEAINNNLLFGSIAIPAIEPKDIESLHQYRIRNSYAKIGVGLHPWFVEVKFDSYALEKSLEQIIKQYSPNFVGETGLDKNKPNFRQQLQSLEVHLNVAEKFGLPINLHCVAAYNELLEILKVFPRVRGVVHAYNNNWQTARQLANKNMLVGIGSIILKANSQLVKSIEMIGLEQIVIETDAPYMPALDKQKSSLFDSLIYAQRLSQLLDTSLFEIIRTTNKNWKKLYQ